ncbi:MAG: serine/threonine-protein kinase [Ktedonobacteraceae bacterium]
MSTNSSHLGKYELLERLGQGGMADVWKARDTQLQRYVAIKILHANLQEDPNFITRFEREAQFIASLHHPNIMQIHDFQVASPLEANVPIAYMVMDYVEGGTLADYIASTSAKGTIPSPAHIVNLFTSIGLAVDYAHLRGMIHRDIKPANILLDKQHTARNPMGEPILTDFGVAKLLAVSSSVLSSSQAGTPLYISPEQASGYPGNERSDLYALGVILYEMVTGVLPFRGDTPVAVIMQHINVAPTDPALINPNVPASLSMVILKALAKDPNARFASASAMTVAIAEALNIPVPESLHDYRQDTLNRPTYGAASGQPGMTPLPATPSFDSMGATHLASLSSAQSQPMATSGEGGAAMNVQRTPLPTPPPVAPFLPPVRPRRRRRALYLALIVLAMLVLLGSGVGAYLGFFQKKPTSGPVLPPASQVVGQAFFISTGQYDARSAQGIADELEIDLQNLPSPHAGKSYYAWLLADIHPQVEANPLQPQPLFKLPLLLTPNALPVKGGKASFLYTGTAHHDNLFSLASRLLITEEDTTGTPRGPAADRSMWRYYAQLPQTPYGTGTPQLSALDHIRHLFYKETVVDVLGLPGGLDVWLYRNTEKLMEWGTAARDDYGKNPGEMHVLFISMLDYLDGSPNVHLDIPGGAPVYADQTAAQVSLLSVDPVQQKGTELKNNPPGYVSHIPIHLNGVINAPDVTPEMVKISTQILTDLNNAATWLNEARGYARQLAQMDSTQLSQPQTLTMVDKLLTDVTYAYVGKLDPATDQVVPGVLQAHDNIQQLAAFTITNKLPNSI